jgi:hypothetical protein
MARGLREMIRLPLASDPEAVLREQMENRAGRFLGALRQIVFANPQHPYFKMFEEAQCSFDDLNHLVLSRGLEPALEALRQAGVWLSHDEFKGKEPIVRNGRHIAADTASFQNPLAPGVLEICSSGSSGASTQAPASLLFRAHRNCYESLTFREFDRANWRWITLSPILPAPWGLSRPVLAHKLGVKAEHWYAAGGHLRDSGHYRAVTRFLVAEARWLGVPMPPLSFLPPNDFTPAAEDIARARSRGRRTFVTGVAGSCVRVAAAALERGLDISGTRFYTAGEALTDAKAEVVRRAGAEAFATYWVSELGQVGASCSQIGGANRVHLFHDAVAAITHRRKAPGTDVEVDSMLFTSLLPFAPFFVINLEPGDHGVLRPASCNCEFSRFGFTAVISDIYSYTKLTGHGTTLVGTDILRILEEALPARFGGSPGDYQLVEQEAGTETRMVLRVNPQIGKVPAAEIRDFFLSEIRKLFGGALTSRTWIHAASVEVLLEAPIIGRTGKILPLHLLGPDHAARVRPGVVHAP